MANLTDLCANSLLDFISVEESGGNYDAYIGNVNAPAGTITGKSLAEVYAFQRELVADGEPSSAVGRYQFIDRTLSALVQAAGTPLTAPLSAELQDDYALSLLEQRGYRAWLAGSLTDAGFAHSLSCEWASLPDPLNDGRSHYDGDGVNSAGRSLAEVYTALETARKGST